MLHLPFCVQFYLWLILVEIIAPDLALVHVHFERNVTDFFSNLYRGAEMCYAGTNIS